MTRPRPSELISELVTTVTTGLDGTYSAICRQRRRPPVKATVTSSFGFSLQVRTSASVDSSSKVPSSPRFLRHRADR